MRLKRLAGTLEMAIHRVSMAGRDSTWAVLSICHCYSLKTVDRRRATLHHSRLSSSSLLRL